MQNNAQPITKIKPEHWFMLIPAILLLGLAPLFIKFFPVQQPALPVSWKLTGDSTGDLFTYGKQILILLAGLLSFLFLYFQTGFKSFKVKENKHFTILVVVTIAWLLLTTLFAKFPHTALWGGIEKYEGLLIWLTYLSFAFYTGVLANKEIYQVAIPRIILVSGLIITGIGLTQFLGHDLIRMSWFKTLIMPKAVAESASFVFEANRVYSTLYNPNFVAMYVATIFPLSVFMIFIEKNKIFKGLWALFSVLLIVNLIGADSTGGFAGLIIAFGILAYVWSTKRLSLGIQKFLNLGLVATAVLVTTLFITGAFNPLIGIQKFSPAYNMSNIATDGFEAKITYKGKILTAKLNKDTLDTITFFTESNEQINVINNENGTLSLDHPDFNAILFSTGVTENKLGYINFFIDNTSWVFLMHPNGLLYVNNFSTTVPFEPSKGIGGFIGYENFGSARGYIWSRTLPLILASPVVGYGADNFVIAFPQNDYNIKYHLYGTPSIIVDKAHNLYLQLAMNFGIPGMLLIFTVIGYACRNLFLAYRSKSEPNYKLNLALLLCIVSYLGSALFYDSNLHVSPFLWTFVGFGLKDVFKA